MAGGGRNLRILMVSHVPLVAELGAGRVQLELAAELRRLGHEVETFDPRETDARARRARRIRATQFPAAARAHVRAHGARFDVVDAHHGCLPFGKRDLGFEGALVARSSGLYAFYEEFARYARSTWTEQLPGTRAGQALVRRREGREYREARRSLELCDLALLLTDDEVSWAREQLPGPAERWVAVPNGIAATRAAALAAAAAPPAVRLAAREVVAIGWSLRKGAADWPRIVARLRKRVPGVRFRFLGTGSPAVPLPTGADIEVVPAFRTEELPRLLSGATVGLLPTYAEGFGLGLLEQLASGLPSAAYDVSGPRAQLGRLDASLLLPRGDADAIADRAAALLRLDTAAYAALGDAARATARSFLWQPIATTTAAHYERALARLSAGARAA